MVDATPPTSSAGPSKGIPLASFNATQSQKTARVYEQYKCIVCDSELSSKGVCKRHLEEQHITPKVWQCERCPSFFDTKAESKKHCSQCGDGDLSYVATKITRKVYACEFTGSCFQSLDNYLRNLLVLSEQRDPRPRPDLKKKIDALLGWVERRNAKFGPVVGEASNDLFGVPEAWKELQWDPDYLRGKIAVLEHATFNEDGTMGSSRWTGSSPKQRNTKTYITQLFQAGRLPKNYSAGTHIKPEAMSICSTPMPLSHKPPSVASGPSSADTPLRMTSPYPRSHSRQTVYSHEAMDQRTSTSTPRSNGDEVMTAELKSKRHLSDESRAYIPARTPPGPPDPPTDQYQYLSDPTMMGQPPQLPPLPAFTTPSNSSVCLPLRKVDGAEAMPPPHQSIAPTAQHYGHHHQHPLYHHLPPQHSTNTFSNSSSSDLASETSTLAQSYREPEYSSVPMDYHMWQQQQQQLLAFQQQQQQHAGYGGYGAQFDYSMPDDASIVASSVNTGNTIGVDYVTEIPKMEGFEGMDLSGGAHGHGQVGTFYLGDEEEGRR